MTTTAEDARILRALSLYRLLLTLALLLARETGLLQRLLSLPHPALFHGASLAYALAALAFAWPGLVRRMPTARLAVLTFVVDALAVATLTAAAGGVESGLGALLITPTVACAMVVSRREATLIGMLAVAVMAVQEALTPHGLGLAGAGALALLALVLFGTARSAHFVASRAREGESLAQRMALRVGRLTRLQERILEQMDTGILVLDDDRIQAANAAARRLLGIAGTLDDESLAARLPALAERVRAWRQSPLVPPEPLPNAQGDPLIVQLQTLGPGDNAPLLLRLDSDTLLRRRAQQIKLAALGRLSAGIAHEVRNPLAAIRQAGQLLAESPRLQAEDWRLLEIIDRNGRRIDGIVRDVLDLARTRQPQADRLRLRGWLEKEIRQYLEQRAGPVGGLTLGELDDRLTVYCDPSQLRQILHNLWDNSYAHGGGTAASVHVTLGGGRMPGGETVFLDSCDDGIGIDPERGESMFEPFVSGSRTGSGLGLYLARELAEYNRMQLDHHPNPGGGACFRLLFAAAPEENTEHGPPPGPDP